MWFDFDQRWTADQRQTLLRADLNKPLSVDRVIWPSVFIADFSLADMEWWEVANALPIPVSYRTREGLWNDLEAMNRQVEEWPRSQPVWTVAITVEPSPGVTGALTWPGTLPPTHDRIGGALDPAWTLLGYDVGEPGLWSAIVGAATRLDASAWAGRLNAFHLFDDLGDARAFLSQVSHAQPERTPFEVFGIYRIEPRTESREPR